MIWLVTGASLGHVLPAISFYYWLESVGIERLLVVENFDSSNYVISRLGLTQKVFFLPQLRSPRKDLLGFLDTALFDQRIKSRIELLWERYRPTKVVFFGSPLSLLLSWQVIKNKIPFAVQEQNVTLGLVSSVLSVPAEKIFAGFCGDKFPGYVKNKTVISSNFPSNYYDQVSPEWNFSNKEKLKVLVLGGSKGAQALNKVIPLLLEDLKEEIEVLHIAGRDKEGEVIREYAFRDYPCVRVVGRVFPLLPILKQADLVISRSGAMTLTEIALAGAPTVLIPYPFARGHQYINAEFFKDRVGLDVIDQRSPNWQMALKSSILSLVGDEKRRKEISARLKETLRWEEDALRVWFS